MALHRTSQQHPTLARHHEMRLRSRIFATAQKYVGTTYKYGGKDKEGGIDCSGFITNVLLEALDSQKFKPLVQNIALLRTSAALETVDSPENGDLILWNGHGGIVWDSSQGTFIGSQSSTGVAIASYKSGYWSEQPGMIFRKFGSYFSEWSKDFLGDS